MLLPRCMRRLLGMATTRVDESGEGVNDTNVGSIPAAVATSASARVSPVVAGAKDEWKSIVHALNVLRVVFVDATLANDVGPYVTEVGQNKAQRSRPRYSRVTFLVQTTSSTDAVYSGASCRVYLSKKSHRCLILW